MTESNNSVKDEQKINIQVVADANTLLMIETIKQDMNIRSISQAVLVLIKKGYDQYQREQNLILANTI